MTQCALFFLIALSVIIYVSEGNAQEESSPPPDAPPTQTLPVQDTGADTDLDPLALDGDLVEAAKPSSEPEDPCLHPLYKDWHEMSLDIRVDRPDHGFVKFQIVLDRSDFSLSLEGIRRDESTEVLYQSPCGLGDVQTPTPEGRFIINHVYCYSDVVLFATSGERIPMLYNGFFAPLLECDRGGRCRRYRDLGIHGFNRSANPDPRVIRNEVCGAVSSGCIRVPDPCNLKSALIRFVGVGPLKKNDRGSYHWLDKPVVVLITGDYPGSTDQDTVMSIVEKGLNQVQHQLKGLWNAFGP
jgi:hypothetical protein